LDRERAQRFRCFRLVHSPRPAKVSLNESVNACIGMGGNDDASGVLRKLRHDELDSRVCVRVAFEKVVGPCNYEGSGISQLELAAANQLGQVGWCALRWRGLVVPASTLLRVEDL
jgi:hypothetical protein